MNAKAFGNGHNDASNAIGPTVENFAEFGASANGNVINGFNDTITSGGFSEGREHIIGDVSATMNASVCGDGYNYAENHIDLTAENKAIYGGSANGNTINAFNDVIAAAAGFGTIVGDVSANMDASAHGSGYNYASNAIGPSVGNVAFGEGAQANGNIINGFNNTISVASGSSNTLVGDVNADMNAFAGIGVQNTADNHISMTAANIAGRSATANGNTINAFNDSISVGGGDDNFIVGDVNARMSAEARGEDTCVSGSNAEPGEGYNVYGGSAYANGYGAHASNTIHFGVGNAAYGGTADDNTITGGNDTISVNGDDNQIFGYHNAPGIVGDVNAVMTRLGLRRRCSCLRRRRQRGWRLLLR